MKTSQIVRRLAAVIVTSCLLVQSLLGHAMPKKRQHVDAAPSGV